MHQTVFNLIADLPWQRLRPMVYSGGKTINKDRNYLLIYQPCFAIVYFHMIIKLISISAFYKDTLIPIHPVIGELE